MVRLALAAGLMTLALTAPTRADGMHRPAGDGYAPAHPRATAPWVSRRRPAAYGVAARPRVQPVSYGETDGEVHHAWLPRNERLPIYNIPPPFFPEE
ncbi:hypothetical protein [Methylobacterium oryzisoli]|uniref:hypothetical protein n=1 Tax=Methylobacterium oryzisoli TaxID=3385502 RepID=UPI003892BE5A